MNGSLILEADNMFRSWNLEVKRELRPGENTLEILFRSPLPPTLEARAALPYRLPAGNDRGDPPTRVFVRKAAYHFGWDWGPLADVRLSEKDHNSPKSMNAHLHVMEAYTNLLRVWEGEGLRDRLSALVEIHLERGNANLILFRFLGADVGVIGGPNQRPGGHMTETQPVAVLRQVVEFLRHVVVVAAGQEGLQVDRVGCRRFRVQGEAKWGRCPHGVGGGQETDDRSRGLGREGGAGDSPDPVDGRTRLGERICGQSPALSIKKVAGTFFDP